MINTIPFLVGTTSYIVPDDLLANARYLAGRVQDMELVLFDLEDGQSNLPGPEVVDGLKRLAGETGLRYTVHLPVDLRLGVEGAEDHISLRKARRVIDTIRALDPFAYVLHLDGREVKEVASPAELARWHDQAVRALDITAGWAGDFQKLAVENLEGYPIDFIEPVVERVPVSRCVDIGHLWLDGHDPLAYLARAISRTRVIHLHGISGRDHQSLAHMPAERVDALVRFLIDRQYNGVLTLEIFGEPDFHSSLQALHESCQRVNQTGWMGHG